MGREEMRAGDADRQQVADRLRLALDEGRLDLHEYDERLQRAYAAKTYGDLDGLLDDLPAATPALAVPQPAADPYHHATRRWLWNTWEEYLGVVGLVIGIWAVISVAAQELVYFWPIWVAGPWGVVLIGQTISGLGKGEPRRWVDREERKRQDKAAKKERKAEQKARKEAAGAAGGAGAAEAAGAADAAFGAGNAGAGTARGAAGSAGSAAAAEVGGGPRVALPREPAQPAVTADSLFADPTLVADPAVGDPTLVAEPARKPDRLREPGPRQAERQPRSAD
ncbi:hypothetical protein J3R04_001850 [Spirilliplanes yamanashiensis]|nr:hypothetical protein [Spirilliplanes yamanashiensis]